MTGLLGLAFFICWFLAAYWLVRNLTRKMGAGILRNSLVWLMTLSLIVLPLVDEIIGGFQFRALCRRNAVLKIDAEKIKGKTVRMVNDPANRDTDETVIRIYYTKVSYRDVVTQEELGSNGYLVAMGGKLMSALSGGQETTPMTIFPSTCSGPGNLPVSEKYEFKIDTKAGK